MSPAPASSTSSKPATEGRPRLRLAARRLLSIFMITMGVLHFTHEPYFTAIMPPWLPAPRTLVWVSGIAEFAGGVGLEIPRLRMAAAWGLVALFVAVYPANLHMAIHDVPVDGVSTGVFRWIRLPFQALFIAWAWWFTRPQSQGRS